MKERILEEAKKAYPGRLYRSVVEHYQEPHRKYHNLQHIQRIWEIRLSLVDRFPFVEDEDRKFLFATLFHDIIYNVGSKTNEIDSAEKFLNFLGFKSKYSDPFVTEIYDVIVASRNHCDIANAYLLDWQKLFLDIDLYDIGGSEEIYAQNGEKIVEEFSSKFRTDEITKGRMAWIESMLANRQIFWILTEREDQARRNMGYELTNLKHGKAENDPEELHYTLISKS